MSAIDYDLTQIRAFAFDVDGVLSPSTIPMSADGEPLRMVNIKDGFALQLAVKRGFKIAIITGGRSKCVQVRYASLGVKDIFQGTAHKLPVLIDWMNTNNLQPSQVIYMGDDIPDIPAMKAVGLPCAPADAAPEVREIAAYITPQIGGYGCVRRVIEEVLRAQSLWIENEDAFGW